MLNFPPQSGLQPFSGYHFCLSFQGSPELSTRQRQYRIQGRLSQPGLQHRAQFGFSATGQLQTNHCGIVFKSTSVLNLAATNTLFSHPVNLEFCRTPGPAKHRRCPERKVGRARAYQSSQRKLECQPKVEQSPALSIHHPERSDQIDRTIHRPLEHRNEQVVRSLRTLQNEYNELKRQLSVKQQQYAQLIKQRTPVSK